MSNNKILSIFLGLVLIGVSVFCYFNFFKTSDNKKEESSKGTVITATKFEADIYLYSTAEGGRRTQIYENYRPQFRFGEEEVMGIITFMGNIDMVKPGEHAKFSVELQTPASMSQGSKFNLLEGKKLVGEGKVIKIIE